MPSVTVRIEGADELKAQVEALQAKARGAILEKAALKGAKVIEQEAERNAPGPHIVSEVRASGTYAVEFGIGPDAAHWYYGFFETGTGAHIITPKKGRAIAFVGAGGEAVRFLAAHPGMKARPFLRPALDSKSGEATAAVGDELRRGINSVARG